jgi:hypothetical protein
VVVRHTHFGGCYSDDSIHRRNDCTKLLTQIAAALAIVVALAPLRATRGSQTPNERQQRPRFCSKNRCYNRQVHTRRTGSLSEGGGRREHHSFRRQFRGNGLGTALDKATSKAQKAISRWLQASRLPEALAHLPNRVPGLAITKSKQHDGSSYFAGTFTTPEGCVFCWTRTVVFVKDPS